ncbi:MAG TPA: DUF3617 domain-containing protein [Vicinamibacterales bacterium]
MHTPLRLAGAAAAALSITALVAAQSPMLDVKMGLWETTTKINMGNMPQMPQLSEDQLAKMPPAQRAQIENMMKTMQGAPVTVKTCMTKEKFQKNSFMQERPNQNCKQTITNNTAKSMDAAVVCTGPSAMTAQMHIEAVSSTEYKGHMTGKANARGGEMDMTVDMNGKWLGADCGDVK